MYLPFLAVVSLTFASTADDPFITLRYAANLVHGLGLTYTPGPPAQGFTSPLHLVVAVIAYLTPGGHALLVLKLASLLFGFLALREAAHLIYGIAIPRWARRTACLVVATNWVMAFSSSNALETTLLVWLLMAITRRLILGECGSATMILGVLGGAAVLTRLDSILPIGCLVVASGLIERGHTLRDRISWVLGPVVALVLSLVGSLAYFRSLLPNTYYAKDVPAVRSFWLGIDYLINSLQPHAWLSPNLGDRTAFALFLIELFLILVGSYGILIRYKRCAYLPALVAGQVLFIVKSGGDWMIGGRFLAPAIIPLLIIQVLGCVEIAGFAKEHLRARARRTSFVIGAVILAAVSLYPYRSTHAPVTGLTGLDNPALLNFNGYGPIWRDLATTLQCLPPGSLVATTEIGYLGFFRQDLRILDLHGLTNKQIATGAPASVKTDAGVVDQWDLPSSTTGRVIVQQKPAVIAALSTNSPRAVVDGDYRVAKMIRFNALVSLSFFVKPTFHDPGCL